MKLFKHLKTVHTHRKAVRKLCFRCGLYKQGLLHDLSKYSLVELIPSVKYWSGDKSPIDNQIKDIGYSEAWLHHKGRNKHHYEYWIDQAHKNKDGKYPLICDMPDKYIIEMFCDRVGACKAYLGENYIDDAPLKYALGKAEHEREMMSERTYTILMGLLRGLANFGEDYVCAEIKKALRSAGGITNFEI